jgi:hypothetical protein
MKSTIMILALGAILSGALHSSAFAQANFTSCSEANHLCTIRCQPLGGASCVRENCAPKAQTCRMNGCWQEAPRFGGQLTCNLKKT